MARRITVWAPASCSGFEGGCFNRLFGEAIVNGMRIHAGEKVGTSRVVAILIVLTMPHILPTDEGWAGNKSAPDIAPHLQQPADIPLERLDRPRRPHYLSERQRSFASSIATASRVERDRCGEGYSRASVQAEGRAGHKGDPLSGHLRQEQESDHPGAAGVIGVASLLLSATETRLCL